MKHWMKHSEPADEYEGAFLKDGRWGVAWQVLGWETEPDEDTEWSGYEQRTGRLWVVMIGDDRVESADPDDLEPLRREDYCGECGQTGCGHDGYDRDDDEGDE